MELEARPWIQTEVRSSRERLALKEIVETFQVGINEEQGWAVLHQGLRCYHRSMLPPDYALTSENSNFPRLNITVIEPDTENLFLDKDGEVVIGNSREENELGDAENFIRHLAFTVYGACQYNTAENQEADLSVEFGTLLEQLVEDGRVDDQQHDTCQSAEMDQTLSPSTGVACIDQLLKMTQKHCTSENGASAHYQAVCHALVVECLDFSEFLQHVQVEKPQETGSKLSKPGNEADKAVTFCGWAKAWMHVIRELRAGVQLRKVSTADPNGRTWATYELTPFEMLMEDIRLRRFALKTIPLSAGDRQPLDAHDQILEYIRSRPQLSPVQNRRLKPRPTYQSTTDLLLTSIRQFIPEKLRKTPAPQPKDHFENYRSRQPYCFDRPETPAMSYPTLDYSPEKTPTVTKRKLIIPDEIDQTPVDFLLENLDTSGDIEEENELDLKEYAAPDGPSQTDNIGSASQSKNGAYPDVVSLTLDEIALIRGALAKAELENLEEQNAALFDAIRSSKVCFSCRRVKFSQFSWMFRECGVKCHLCQNTVCTSCSRQMVLPCDRLDRIPVHTLSPVLDDDDISLPEPLQQVPLSQKRAISSASTMPRQRLSRSVTHDFSGCSTLPKPQPRQRPPLQRGLTMSVSARSPPTVVASSWPAAPSTRRRISLTAEKKTAVVIQVCIECHSVLYHAIMESQTQVASVCSSRMDHVITMPSSKSNLHGTQYHTSASSMISDSRSDSLDEDFEDLGDFLDERDHHNRLSHGDESVSPANSRSDSTSSEAGSFYSNHI